MKKDALNHIDYNRSLLSLTSSVLNHFGVQATHSTLPEFDELLNKNFKNVVVMLFDGMGTAILEKHIPENSFLRRNLKSTIKSVFPPTTTAATVTIETGLSPIEHGWLGWSLYFRELNANVNIFPNTLSGSNDELAADYNVARGSIPYNNIFRKIHEKTNYDIGAYYISPFSEYEIKSVAEICRTVKSLCNENSRKYIYTYWAQPDYDMHDLGTTHEQITANIQSINDEVEAMCGSISDTLVIITADHGLVDTEWRFIPDYPKISDCLERMPSIETRAMTFFIKPGMKERFVTEFEKCFGDCFLLLSKEEVLDKQIFGNGTPHPRALGFIGDYLAIATSNISIVCSSNRQDLFKAAHAGLTEAEMNVPFIAVECKYTT